MRLQYRSAWVPPSPPAASWDSANSTRRTLWGFAERSLATLGAVEQITTLGRNRRRIEPCAPDYRPNSSTAHRGRQEATEALQDCIAPTGREARSEALEHRMEHMIMRKQEQIDLLERVRRNPPSSARV